MSLQETAQIYEYLVRIDQLLSGMTVKTETINRNIGAAPSSSGGESSLRRELRIVNLYLVAIQNWSGDSNAAGFLNTIRQTEAAVLRLVMAINAANTFLSSPTIFGALYTGAMSIGFLVTMQNMGDSMMAIGE